MSPVLRSAASLGLAVLLLGAGCPEEERTRPVPRPTPPVPEGVVRLGYPVEPSSLNPIEADTSSARDILRAVLPSFHVTGPDLVGRPSLLAAEPEVELAEQRMEVRFRIRDDAVWSDGKPITVEDVAFTWQVMTDEDLDVAVGDGFEYVLGVTRDGPKDGRLVFDPPYAGWKDLFSSGRFVLPARGNPADVADWDKGPPVSGGPFLVEEWERGRSVELRANPNAWGAPPAAEGISVQFVPDPTTAIQLLEAGELDAVAPMLGAAWTHRLGQVEGAEVTTAYGPAQVQLVIDPDDVGSAEERRRIAEAIDRDRLTDVLIRGAGRASHGVLTLEQPGAISSWATYGTRGRRRITGKELRLIYPRGDLTELTARYIQGQLEAAGGKLELVSLEAEVFWNRWFPQRRFTLALWESRSGMEGWLQRWFGSDADERIVPADDEGLNGVLASIDFGGPEGATATAAAQELLARSAVVLPLFQINVAAAARGVTGVRANPTVEGILWNAAQWKLEAA